MSIVLTEVRIIKEQMTEHSNGKADFNRYSFYFLARHTII